MNRRPELVPPPPEVQTQQRTFASAATALRRTGWGSIAHQSFVQSEAQTKTASGSWSLPGSGTHGWR